MRQKLKKRAILIACTVLIVVVGALLLRRFIPSTTKVASSAVVATQDGGGTSQAVKSAGIATNMADERVVNELITNNPSLTNIPESGKILFLQMWKRGIASNVPIRFYGKVVDQDGVGVTGVSVVARVSQFDTGVLHDLKRSGQKYVSLNTVTTTAQGRFVFDGATGNILEVQELSRNGYEPAPTDIHSFSYVETGGGVLHPDPEHPVIFHMWKKGKSEQLIVGELGSVLVCDGTDYTFNLLKRKVGDHLAEGDIRVVCKAGNRQGNKFDWTAEIVPIDGKITEKQDVFPYQAPEDGYQPSYTISMLRTNSEWQREVTKRFYLYSRGSQVCSSIDLLIAPRVPPRQGLIMLKFRSNPSGSRNLE